MDVPGREVGVGRTARRHRRLRRNPSRSALDTGRTDGGTRGTLGSCPGSASEPLSGRERRRRTETLATLALVMGPASCSAARNPFGWISLDTHDGGRVAAVMRGARTAKPAKAYAITSLADGRGQTAGRSGPAAAASPQARRACPGAHLLPLRPLARVGRVGPRRAKAAPAMSSSEPVTHSERFGDGPRDRPGATRPSYLRWMRTPKVREGRTRDRNGSPGRTRTSDKAVNSRLLYQLSYWGSPMGRGYQMTGTG